MNKIAIALILAGLAVPAWAKPQANNETCGWLVLQGDELVEQPDAGLRPGDPTPLARPPRTARAAYCVRDTEVTYVGDERIIDLSLPLVIRSGDRESVLEANPTVMFNYHKVGDSYRPGRPDNLAVMSAEKSAEAN